LCNVFLGWRAINAAAQIFTVHVISCILELFYSIVFCDFDKQAATRRP